MKNKIKNKLKTTFIYLFLILMFGCAVVHVDEIDNKKVVFTPPPHKWVLGVTTKNIFATKNDEPEGWVRVAENKDTPYVYDNLNKKEIETFYAAHYCRGGWLVAGEIIEIDLLLNSENLGSHRTNKMVIYWNDRQSPVAAWERYEIKSPGNKSDEGLLPRGITCNETTGKWYIAASHYLMTSHNPKDPDGWTLQHTSDIATGSGLHAKSIKSFGNTTYAIFVDGLSDAGYIGIQKGDNPWELKHINSDLKLPTSFLHSYVFDPTTNKIVIGTTKGKVLYCAVGTLDCKIAEVRSGTDALATNYRGEFLGVSYATASIHRSAKSPKWDVSPTGGRHDLAIPRIYATKILFLNGYWYLGGQLGHLAYLKTGDNAIKRSDRWTHVNRSEPFCEDGDTMHAYCGPSSTGKWRDHYNYGVAVGGARFGGSTFTALISGGL